MSDRQHNMSSFSSGRGTPGETSYPHPGSTHGYSAHSGTYGNPTADFRPQSSSSNLNTSMAYPSRSGQAPWASGQRGMGGHPFMHDPSSGMIPRPQSAVAHHARSTSLAHTSSRGYPSHAGPSSRPLPLSPEFGSQVAHYSASEDVVMMHRPQSGHSTKSSQQMEQEISALHEKVKQLELVNHHDQLRIKALERELAEQRPQPGPSGSSLTYTPTAPAPPSVQSSWKARTEARTRLFCSLNRAGNALCAWHDSRRERRAYPPRMAPLGFLNCGCTFEEALFEESLSRHGVGSYHPGENVRMDPALRNPLLRVLQKRYGYQDGDFERDPTTGEWVAGEGNAVWEQKLAQGSLNIRKRSEDRR